VLRLCRVQRVLSIASQISGWIIGDASFESASHNRDSTLLRWVDVLERASPDDQPVAFRLSAARSLHHSGLLLRPPSPEGTAVLLRAGLVALTLLQDDDDEVREVVSQTLIPVSSAAAGAVEEGRTAFTVPTGFPTTEVRHARYVIAVVAAIAHYIVFRIQEFALRAVSAVISSALRLGPASAGKVWSALQDCMLGKESERVAITDLIRADSAALSQKVRCCLSRCQTVCIRLYEVHS
jgi:hypothetical protein